MTCQTFGLARKTKSAACRVAEPCAQDYFSQAQDQLLGTQDLLIHAQEESACAQGLTTQRASLKVLHANQNLTRARLDDWRASLKGLHARQIDLHAKKILLRARIFAWCVKKKDLHARYFRWRQAAGLCAVAYGLSQAARGEQITGLFVCALKRG